MKNINVDQLIAIIGEKEADKLFLNEEWLLKQNENLDGSGAIWRGQSLIPSIPRYKGYSLFYLNSNYYDAGEITNVVIREMSFQDFKNWPKFEGQLDYFYIENSGFMSFDGFDYKVSDLGLESCQGLNDISYLKGEFDELSFVSIGNLENIHNENSIKTKKLKFLNNPINIEKSKKCNIETDFLFTMLEPEDIEKLGIKYNHLNKFK